VRQPLEDELIWPCYLYGLGFLGLGGGSSTCFWLDPASSSLSLTSPYSPSPSSPLFKHEANRLLMIRLL
jgi:hypothetical protein